MTRFLDRRLKLRHLRVLDAIHTHHSLARAAEALALTQPALSKSMREVEQLLEAPLLDRHSRGVRLNGVGERVLVSAKRVLAELNQLDRDLDTISASTELPLLIGALPGPCIALLPPLIARLRRDAPRLNLQFVQGRNRELMTALAAGELDLVIGRQYDRPSVNGMQSQPLYEEPICVMVRAGHPLLQRPSLDADALTSFPIALPTAFDRASEEVERFLEEAGISPRETIRISSAPATRELMLSIDALAVMPWSLMAGDLDRGEILAVPGFEDRSPRTVVLTVNPERPMPASAKAFMAALEAHAATMRAPPPMARAAI